MERKLNLDPFTKLKILSCYKEIKQILNGIIPFPRVVEIMPSNICNHTCKGCHSKALHNINPLFLNFRRLKALIDEFSKIGVEGMEISGGGEPLLYPQVVDLIKYANDKKIKVGLITNGTAFDKKMVKELVKNLLFIRLALDAANRKTYYLIHGHNDYSKVIDNIRHLVKERAANRSHITVGLKFLISQLNYNEIPKAAKVAKSLEVDYLQFKLLRNSRYEIKKNWLEKISRLIKYTQNFAEKKFSIINTTEHSEIKKKCYLTPLHPCIGTNGDVYLCYFFQNRQNLHKIGNIYQDSFKAIWKSDRHVAAIKNIDPRECNVYDCPINHSVEFIDEALIKNKMHLEFV